MSAHGVSEGRAARSARPSQGHTPHPPRAERGLAGGGRREAVVRLRREARAGSPVVRVLVLHGLAGSTAVWRAYEERAPECVELWDGALPWGADGDPEWSISDDPAGHVARALDSVPGGVDVLVAHSFTVGPALEAVVRRDARPRGVVAVAPFHRRDPGEFGWDDAAYYLNGFHRILEEGLRISAGDRLSPQLRAAMALRVRDRIGPYGWQQFFGAYLRSPFLDVDALRMPVLVVAGAEDFAAPPADAAALAAALPDGRLELFEDCGHFAMAEQPERFARAVAGLLRDAVPGADTDAAAQPGPSTPSAPSAPSDLSLLTIPTHRS